MVKPKESLVRVAAKSRSGQADRGGFFKKARVVLSGR